MFEPSDRRQRGHRVALALCLSAYMVLPSCFTSALWADTTAEIHYDLETGETQCESDFAAKLCLTPFTLLLDLVTCPVQACLLAAGNDDEPAAMPHAHDGR